MAWHYFGSHKSKKSTRQLYKEMKTLEQKEKDAIEKALIQERIAEIKHAKRTAIFNRLKSAGKATSEEFKSIGKASVPYLKSGYKEYKKYKKHRRKLT